MRFWCKNYPSTSRLSVRLLGTSRPSNIILNKLNAKDAIGVYLLALNRPDKRNALGADILNDLKAGLKLIRDDPDARCLIISSTSKGSFCAGADLTERKLMNNSEVLSCVNNLRATFTEIETLPIPTIAAINGVAFGGGLELALACDVRIMLDSAKIGLVETSLAIIPGAGGTQRLPRIVGISKAKELIFTSKIVAAAEAKEIGLVNQVVASEEELDEVSTAMARKIASNGPIAILAAKIAISHGSQVSIEQGMKIEEYCYRTVIPTADRLEALSAFADKRKPVFIGA